MSWSFLTTLAVRTRPWRRPYMDAVTGRRGIEIGAPSDIFRRRSLLPLYPVVSALDACNFASNTLWLSNVAEGTTFEFSAGKPAGKQYLCEATDLGAIADGAYDFVLASHVIEHLANPLRALAEWVRITRDDGALVLVVPHKDGTFDHRRPVTKLEHLIADEANAAKEDDTTHLEEWLRLVDLERAPEAKPFEAFRERSLRNVENRGMHHHVFDTRLVVRMVDRAALQIVAVNHAAPHHILVLANKTKARDNAQFLAEEAPMYRASPFVSDQGKLEY